MVTIKPHLNRFILCFAAFLGLAILLGCSAGPVHFKRSVSASQTFERYMVLDDHVYHYYGRSQEPLAIVAVQEGYQLTSPKWKRVDMTTQQLRTWISRMLNQTGSEYNIEPNGAKIMNQHGEKIGIWYAVWELPLLEFESEMAFRISDPVTRFPYTNRDPENAFRLRIP